MEVPRLTGTEMLILAALSQGEQYGLQIVDTIRELTEGKQRLSLGGLYTTLHRMEKKGLVDGRWGEETQARQGARRRYYRVAALGEEAFVETRRVLLATLPQFKPSLGFATGRG